MIKLSIAISALFGVLLSPSRRILSLIIGAPLLQSIPVYQLRTHYALLDFVLAPALFYLLLRIGKLDSYLKVGKKQAWMLTIGNILVLGYVVTRTLASTIEGGGAGFAVAALSPFTLVPGLILLLIGLSLTITNSLKDRYIIELPSSLTKLEVALVVLAIILPLAYNSTLYIGSESLVMKARRADTIFNEKSKIAGEKLLTQPKVEVTELYLDSDGGPNYDQIKNGIYGGAGSGLLSGSLSGVLSYVEVKDRYLEKATPEKYRRLKQFGSWKGEPTNSLSSRYGLFAKDMVNDSDRAMGLEGQEFSIVDLQTNEPIATTTYFINKKNRRFSGHTINGRFHLLDFVTRALNLKLKQARGDAGKL